MVVSSTINQVFVILISLVDLWIGFWVYLSNRKARVNQWFLLMAVFLFLWIAICYFGNVSTSPSLALLLGRVAYGIVALFLIPFYLFFSTFLEENNKFLIFKKVILVSAFLLFCLSIFSNLMVKKMVFTDEGAIPILGVGKFLYFSIIFFVEIFIIIRLFKKYFKLSRLEKLKIQYFLIGTSIFLLANLAFNVVLPFWQEIPKYYYIGNYSAIVLLGFTAYAIVKRELFDIKVVLTSLLVGAISVLLVLDIFVFTTELMFQLYKGLVLVVFLYFGYLLIMSVLREIESRERIKKAYDMEKKAREQIEELTEAKTQFIMATQHHLRTPLTSMIGFLDLIFGGTYG
ncbi:MAG: hypothetical protein ISS87_02895, partial [Candidatus Pacebacteria bacterium]|nr:hypothetical protein [Candidatus Paceibacterota bacterium]